MGEHHAWECQFPSTFCVSFHCVKMDPVLATVMLKGRSEKAFILFCRPLGWTHRRFWNKTMQIRHVYIFNLFLNPSLLFETPSYWQEAMLPSSIPAAEHALTMIVLTFKHSCNTKRDLGDLKMTFDWLVVFTDYTDEYDFTSSSQGEMRVSKFYFENILCLLR